MSSPIFFKPSQPLGFFFAPSSPPLP